MYFINWKTGEVKFLPLEIDGINPAAVDIKGLQVMDSTNDVLVYLFTGMKKDKSGMFVYRVNSNCEKINVLKLSDGNVSDKLIINVTAKQINKDKYVFVGTYFIDIRANYSGCMGMCTPALSENTSSAQGLCFIKVVNNNVEFINYYPFKDLEKYFSLFSEKKQKQILKCKVSPRC